MRKVTIVFLIMAFGLAIAGGVSAQEVSFCPSSMVSYWKLDEGTGTIAIDSIGSNDGVISGATWRWEQVGWALSLDGDDDWVEIPNSGSLNWDTMSVEFWMKGAASQPDPNRYLVIDKKHGFVTPYSGWVMQGISRDGRLQWGICYYDGSNRCRAATTTTDMLDETWHHVAGTYDGSHLRIYVDGALEDTVSYPNIGTWKNNRNVEIGRSWHGGADPHRHFNGQIDEVAIYDSALTSEDIKQHYQNSLKGLPYCTAIPVCEESDESLLPIHDSADNVDLSKGLDEPKIQQILDNNIGHSRHTVTFDGLDSLWLNPGEFDDRLINEGILLEGISGTTWVGGRGDSGPINGQHMDVSPRFSTSRVRVHFVKPCTEIPAIVQRFGVFTTTPDSGRNCMEFYDIYGNSTGAVCAEARSWYPASNIEFIGGTLCPGISYVDIYSDGIPFEVDLLTFNGEIDDTCIPGNTPPVADAGPDQQLECPDTEAVQVTLDGSGSYDPDDDPLSYIWTVPFGTATEVNPEVILPYWGTWTIPLTVDDENGGADSDEINITIGDTTPPTTTASVIGVKGENGVYTSEVTVTLTSTDDCTGVKDIHYIINGIEHIENFNPAVNTGSVSFTLSEDGTHVITYWAVDDAGRVGTTGATSINAAPSTGGGGGGGSGGYYRGCVTVDLQTESDTGDLVYSLDGGATWKTYTGEFTICEERKEVTVSYGYRAPAGNVENPKTLVIKIDRTQPTITAAVQPPANANGWHNTDVTVKFTCADATSGVAACTAPVTVKTEGAGQVVTGTAKDKAGNTATTSVTLNIDKTDPIIKLTLERQPNQYGWYNRDVDVKMNCTDNLSGIEVCENFVHILSDGAGQHRGGWAKDRAGNTAKATVEVNLDFGSPKIKAIVTPAPNANGWHKSDVTVTFECSDYLSGVAECTPPLTVSTEGAGQVVTGTAADKAGNDATASVTLNIDKTEPTITAAVEPPANANGWHNTDVTVTFECSDSLSGVAECPADVTVTTEGAGQVVTGTAADKAGNDATTSVTLNIDKTPPTITAMVVPPSNANGWHNTDVTVTFTCADATSGVAECTAPLTVSTEGAGQVVTGTAVDKSTRRRPPSRRQLSPL
jgi:hypothetical protein